MVQYNHTYASDVVNLKKNKEVVSLQDLRPHTNYTFCVASLQKGQRHNHTCLFFATRAAGAEDLRANPSTTTHYIMTILGCLFGMVIVLGVVYFCLRRRRILVPRLEEGEGVGGGGGGGGKHSPAPHRDLQQPGGAPRAGGAEAGPAAPGAGDTPAGGETHPVTHMHTNTHTLSHTHRPRWLPRDRKSVV